MKKKKQRATVILPTPQGILLTEERNGRYLLPGGHVERGEQPIAAAARELHEETRLTALQLHTLFEYTAEHYQHHVFVAPQCDGQARASSDAVALHTLSFDDLYAGRFPSALFYSSAEILRQFAAQHGDEFLR